MPLVRLKVAKEKKVSSKTRYEERRKRLTIWNLNYESQLWRRSSRLVSQIRHSGHAIWHSRWLAHIYLIGYGTTAVAISGTLQYMLRDSAVYKRAHDELQSAWPHIEAPPTLLQLEQLPYLDACIKDGLRLSYPAPVKMPRIVNKDGYQYGAHFVPPGVSFSVPPL